LTLSGASLFVGIMEKLERPSGCACALLERSQGGARWRHCESSM